MNDYDIMAIIADVFKDCPPGGRDPYIFRPMSSANEPYRWIVHVAKHQEGKVWQNWYYIYDDRSDAQIVHTALVKEIRRRKGYE